MGIGCVPPSPRPSRHQWCELLERLCGMATTRGNWSTVTPAGVDVNGSSSSQGWVSTWVPHGSGPIGGWRHACDTRGGPGGREHGSTVWYGCLRGALGMEAKASAICSAGTGIGASFARASAQGSVLTRCSGSPCPARLGGNASNGPQKRWSKNGSRNKLGPETIPRVSSVLLHNNGPDKNQAAIAP